ncbi:Leu/Phe/Val dehydrogenase [Desmospora profundinema]|uniref:Glutamate dehydrogenase/leucine dehydrogenase n=1 Tax=Desmospora profundinema TaxID=1571184 RepID=A0ABU1INQ9_9BACL|nr:Glu/Leu/Phe/Val dehydrogenase [Desmospora profundinema]MDR6226038.1 glutamate dehydrogenase/leucine dehydrogenase [Desmospora profundinema]
MKVLKNGDQLPIQETIRERARSVPLMEDVFALMERDGHEQVIFCRHKGSGLKGIIAIHDTTMGPALGGCRMVPYESTDAALKDVLRLSKGMTYKCGLADVDFGGGKAVLIGDPQKDKSPEMFRALGRFVGGLNGRFFTGTDMGTDPEDFVHAARESQSFVGLPVSHGGSGDTAIPTAYGVMQGYRATAEHLWGDSNLEGRTIAIQGVGKVGSRLVTQLLEEGAQVWIADTQEHRLEDWKRRFPDVGVAAVDEIHRQPCDIFSPCAIGGVINDRTIDELRCQAVVGSANNQLGRADHGDDLHQRGILYAPDYLVNAGGLIQVADELHGYHHDRVMEKTRGIYEMLLKIYQLSRQEDLPTCRAADRLVLERLHQVGDLKRILLGFDRNG